jgi:hypothetical protein
MTPRVLYAVDDLYMEIYYPLGGHEEKQITLDPTGRVLVTYYDSADTDTFLFTATEIEQVRRVNELEIGVSSTPIVVSDAMKAAGGLYVSRGGKQGFRGGDVMNWENTWMVLYGIIKKKLGEDAQTAPACKEVVSGQDFSNIADPYQRWQAYGIKDYSITERHGYGEGASWGAGRANFYH